MQTSRFVRTSVASAVLGLGAVTAVAATAEAAPQPVASAASQHGSGAGATQTVGVVHPGSRHSEQDVPQHSTKHQTKHHTKHHTNQSGKTRDVRLADGDIAHVTKLPHGTYQAWITRKGVRIAALDAGHSTAHTHGHFYVLNAHTGAVHLR